MAERAVRYFWPLWCVLALVLAAMAFGLHDTLPLEVIWGALVAAALGGLWALVFGLRRFTWPSRAEAVARVDARLAGRPIATLSDTQAINAEDAASAAVWRAHIARMEARTLEARAVPGDLRVSDRDTFGLRYIALLALVMALLFGSLWRIGTVGEAVAGNVTGPVVSGPVWEGWVAPPAYTGKPTLYLADIGGDRLRVPTGSQVTIRLYGEQGALSVAETVSGRTEIDQNAASDTQQFDVTRNGSLSIDGEGGRSWEVVVVPDRAPTVAISASVEVDAMGEMSQPFIARDDYGVVAGTATIVLDEAEVDRRHGLSAAPDPRQPIVVDLPMPFTGDRTNFEEALIEDFSEHPFANLPVAILFEVSDAAEQTGQSSSIEMVLPGRRFFQPMAKAVIEQRRDLLWAQDNASRVLRVLRALSNRPEDILTNETIYLRFRHIQRQMANGLEFGTFDASLQDEVSTALWDLAIQLEEGSLADARARLERAQERLAEAMRNGASDEEIAELMQELRDATNDYMQMLAQRQQQQGDGTDQPQQNAENQFEFTQDELQALMDRIEELMQEGRMAEAQELMEQLNQLMENMQVTQGQQGEGGQSPGEQAMEGLADSLRDQQGLSDEAFRDLQEQFNPDAQAGQSGQNEGRDGSQGQGQQHSPGEGQQGQQQPGEGNQTGPQGGQEGGNAQEGGSQGSNEEGQQQGGADGSLADRQQALRDELERQRGNLPGGNSEAADAAREALDRAGEAMDGAEDALRENDLAEAIDRQAEAMDALREGMRSLGEALARNDDAQQGQGQELGQFAGDPQQQNQDPLGRQMGNQGQLGSDENMVQGDDVYRRAGELLDELRRRSSEQDRPKLELDYLKRLLERF